MPFRFLRLKKCDNCGEPSRYINDTVEFYYCVCEKEECRRLVTNKVYNDYIKHKIYLNARCYSRDTQEQIGLDTVNNIVVQSGDAQYNGTLITSYSKTKGDIILFSEDTMEPYLYFKKDNIDEYRYIPYSSIINFQDAPYINIVPNQDDVDTDIYNTFLELQEKIDTFTK